MNAAPLAPLATLYGAALAVREALFESGISARWRLPRPVVSVGNLTLGGTSKTPLVLWLAERLGAAGLRPGVALRGYGGTYEGPARRVPPRAEAGAARTYGDEACLIARRLPQVPVAVGRSRAHAALMLVNQGQVRAVLLDDGFQHRSLHRDLDIVLLDRHSPFGNGRLLPAGPLREPPSALRRAQVVLLRDGSPSAAGPGPANDDARSVFPAPAPDTMVAACALQPAGLRSPEGEEIDPDRPVRQGCIAFCGIARPASFESMLRALGIRPLELRVFRDHHPFSSLDLDDLETTAARRGAPWLVTTEKDAVRLDGWRPRAASLGILRVALVVVPEKLLLDRVLRACRPEADA